MTVTRNAIVYGVGNSAGYSQLDLPCSNASFPINQGDLVYWDGTAHLLKAIATDGNAATIAGVALQPSAVSSNIDNGSIPAPKSLQVGYNVIADMKSTAAETYYSGTPVYIGADAQTVTTVAGTNKVGVIVLKPGQIPSGSITGAAGVVVPVLIKSTFPA